MNYSTIIAGTMTWGEWGKKFNASQMANMIVHCIREGISTFDHADIYGDYTTEEAFGNAFKATEVKRESIKLISKCGIQLLSKQRPNKVKHYDYSKHYILNSVERSLNKLQTNYLDLLLIHRPSPLMSPTIIAESVSQLMSKGKVKAFGVSNFTPSQMDMLGTHIQLSANQVECSLIQPQVMFNGTLDYAITHGQTVMAWSPLGSYFKTTYQQKMRIAKVLSMLTAKYKASEEQLLLAWILKHPAQIKPVIGTGNFERITSSTQCLNIELDLEDWFLLLEASNGHETP